MNVWELIIQQPLTNVLIVISNAFGNNFGIAIFVLTILVNLALLPLTLSQIRYSKKMQELQPKLAELQKKYGKDKQKLSEETMKLYKGTGCLQPGCVIPMLVQFPVWIALYQSIMIALAAVPESLLNLSRYLYDWPIVYSSLPLSPYFLGMNLAQPNIVMAVLVGASMWVQQKMSATPSADPRAAAQGQMMNWMLPLIFAFLGLTFPSGLSLYWVASSLFRIILQYRVSGWGSFSRKPYAGAGAGKKYVSFESEEPKKPKDGSKVKPKDQVIITDKESLKKSQKSSRFTKFFQGEDEDREDQG